ncbi:MAG TPA: YtxH domain-containing protein, partial [Candidatus Polarisedimenticolaceae bacterium]|nr:YtxH domain-containing protein [Candidatus Polarisedimenticolaceae bacterium]
AEKKKGFVTGALIGTLIGGVTALLFAPKSGKETQADIKQKAQEVVKSANARLVELETELDGRIDSLKVAAKELHGEAYEESQRLITRAEILRNDLEASISRLTKTGRDAKQDAAVDAKRLIQEGQDVITELERTTKKVMGSVRNKVSGKTAETDKHDKKED